MSSICPKCGLAAVIVESIEHGIDHVSEEGYYLTCTECDWESEESFETWEEADKNRRKLKSECHSLFDYYRASHRHR